MGYDVDAFIPYRQSEASKAILSAAFEEASEDVRKVAGGVDGFLTLGSLDCGDCISFLEKALGRKGGPGAGIWPP